MEGQFYRRKMSEEDPFFEINPRPLPTALLPTNGDVIGRLLMIRVEIMEAEEKHLDKHMPMERCMKKACDEVLDLWEKASLPTRSRQCVLKEIRKLWKTREGSKKCKDR